MEAEALGMRVQDVVCFMRFDAKNMCDVVLSLGYDVSC